MYATKILDHYQNPRNVGSLDPKAVNVGTGLAGAPACGDVIRLQIEVDSNERITRAVFKTFGCGSAIASSSWTTELLIGKTLDEALCISNQDIVDALSLSSTKIHCSVLTEEVVKAAIDDYRQKQQA